MAGLLGTDSIRSRPRSSSVSNTTDSSFSKSTIPFSIVHRVFVIQEILCCILHPFRLASKDIDNAERRDEARYALAALARTCKLFHEFSLNYLWETMPSIVPIVLLLSDSVSQVGTTVGSRRHAIIRVGQVLPTTGADIKRLMKYAPRIRNLVQANQSLRPSPDVIVDVTAFEALSKIEPKEGAGCLFPNIRLLQWPIFGVSDECIDFAFIFLGPKVADIDIIVPDPSSNGMDRTLEMLHSHPPPTKSLSLQTHSFDSDATPALINSILLALGSLTRVELEYPCWHLKEWTALAGLPNLASLWICIPIELEDKPTPVKSAFPSLTELTLQFQQGGVLFEAFLDHFIEHRLSQLTALTLMYEAPEDNIYTLLHNLSRMCDPQILETIKITHWGSGPSSTETEDEQADVSTDTFTPLYTYSNLRTVLIQPMKYMDLDNSTIDRMAGAWPKIEYLEVGDPWVSPSRVTVEGLVSLARHSPNLHTLSISINGLAPISEEAIKEVRDDHWSSPLRSLYLANSPIIDPSLPNQERTIAWYLGTIFPSLQQLTWDTNNKDGSDPTKGWPYVSSILSSGESLEIPIAEKADAPAGEQSS